MQNLGAFTPTKFVLKLVQNLYNKTLHRLITNNDFEGEIKQAGDTVVVRTAAKINLNRYTKNMTLVSQELNPIKEEMKITEQYYFKFEVDDVDKIQNDISAIDKHADEAREAIDEMIDTDVINYARENVIAKNIIGASDYSTGTVAVSAAGVVTGSGASFTAEMVGGLFTSAGDDKAYVIESLSGGTLQLRDQGGEAYTGGIIAPGTSYEIKGATAITLTKDNIYSQLVKLSTKMSQAKTPRLGRFIVVNAEFEGVLREAPQFTPAIETAYKNVVVEGGIGKIAGFDVYTTEVVQGNDAGVHYFWAGTQEYMTLAIQILETSVIPSGVNTNQFVDICKGLVVWGRKVFAGNRGRSAILKAKFA